MNIPNIVNVKVIMWPDGDYAGSRILDTTKTGELYFTKNAWTYFCRQDPCNKDIAIITSKIPRSKMFTQKNQPMIR